MTLAAILGISLALQSMNLDGLRPALAVQAAQSASQQPAANSQDSPSRVEGSQAPAPPSPSPEGAQATPSSPEPAPAAPVKAPKKHARPKKNALPDCSNSATPLNTAAGAADSGQPKQADSASPSSNNTSAGNAVADNSGSATSGSATPGSATPNAAKEGGAALNPCPPPRKVVRNGGSSEPIVELRGGTAAQKAFHENSTAELTAATEENLNRISGHELNASQQDMVSQIKQFLEQSRAAVTKGDLERGRNLAMKARLLSDELVRP